MIKAMMLGKKRKASIAAAMAFFLAVSCIQWPVMPVALAQSGNGDSQQVSSGNGQEQEEKQEDGSVSGSNALSVQTYGNEAKMTGDTQVSQLPCGQEEDNQDILYVSKDIIMLYAKTYEALFMLLCAYLIILLPLSFVFSLIESRLKQRL